MWYIFAGILSVLFGWLYWLDKKSQKDSYFDYLGLKQIGVFILIIIYVVTWGGIFWW